MAEMTGWALMLSVVSIGVASCCACQPRETPPNRTSELDEAGRLMRADLEADIEWAEVAVGEYFSNWGKFPVDNKDAGLPEPAEFQGKTLRSATVGRNGVIEFAFDAKSGEKGGRARLVADTSQAATMPVQWRCESSDYPQIKRVMPTCNYVGN